MASFKCTVCNKFFQTQQALSNHVISHNVVLKQCDQCKLLFKGDRGLNAHLKKGCQISTNDDDMTQCTECKRTFKGEFGLLTHQRLGCYFNFCPVCQKQIPTASKMKTHMKTHALETMLSCPVCTKMIHKAAMTKHLKKHNYVLVYCEQCKNPFKGARGLKAHLSKGCHVNICKECKQQFNTPSMLKRHQTTHTGEKRVDCLICKKSFYHKGALKIHMTQVHGRQQKRKLPKVTTCDMCEKSFCSFRYAHFANCHKKLCLGNYDDKFKNDSKIKCSFCEDLVEVMDYALHRHMELSDALFRGHGRQSIQCDKCQHNFASGHYKLHVDVHKTREDFKAAVNIWKCGRCGKRYHYSGLRQRHEARCGRVAISESAKSCLFCGKICLNYSTLELHTRSHTHEKPYFCDTCVIPCATLSSLKQHYKTDTHKIKAGEMTAPQKYSKLSGHVEIITHPPVPVFICTCCKFEGKTMDELMVHRKEHHELKELTNCEAGEDVESETHEEELYQVIDGRTKCHTCYLCSKSFYGPIMARIHVQLCEAKHEVVMEPMEEIESSQGEQQVENPEIGKPCLVLVKH